MLASTGVRQHLPARVPAACLLHGADVAAEHQQEFPGKGSAEQELYVRAATSPSSIRRCWSVLKFR